MKGCERDRQTQQLSFSLIKSFLFSSDTWADNGLATRRSHVSELSPFPSGLISCLMQMKKDEGWWCRAARCRKEALSGGYWARSHLEATNPRKQLQPSSSSSSSSSRVTMVTGFTNPLTHSHDHYLALDLISWVWLGRDKLPLLGLWYPNERGSEAYVWYCLGVMIRD